MTLFTCEGNAGNLLFASQILLKQICLLVLFVEGFKLLLIDILNHSGICGLYLLVKRIQDIRSQWSQFSLVDHAGLQLWPQITFPSGATS